MTESHFTRHRAFRKAKYTFDNVLTHVLSVAGSIQGGTTVLTSGEAEELDKLQDVLLPNNLTLAYWTSDRPNYPADSEATLIAKFREVANATARVSWRFCMQTQPNYETALARNSSYPKCCQKRRRRQTGASGPTAGERWKHFTASRFSSWWGCWKKLRRFDERRPSL